MALRFVVFLLMLPLASVGWTAATSCTQDSLDSCSSLKPSFNSTSLNGTSQANYTSFCNQAQNYQSCLREISCSSSDNLDIFDQLLSNLTAINATIFTTCRASNTSSNNSAAASSECSMQNIDRCLTLLPAELVNNMTKPWSAADFDRVCGNPLDEYERCLHAITCPNTPQNITLYSKLKANVGVLNMYRYLCLNDTRTVFISNFDCLYSAGVSSAVVCHNSAVSGKNISATNVCRVYDDMLHCMFNNVKQSCSDDVARVFVTSIMINYEQSIGAVFGCSFGSIYATCNQRNIQNCTSVFPTSSSSSSSSLFTLTDFTRTCNSSLDTVAKCLATVNCTKERDVDFPVLLSANGSLYMYQYMCASDVKSIAVNNFDCLQSYGAASVLSCYNSSFPANLNHSTFTDICIYYNRQMSCAFQAVSVKCNIDAARVYVTGIVKSYQPRLSSAYQCTLNLDAITYSPSGTALLVSSALLITTAAAAVSAIMAMLSGAP